MSDNILSVVALVARFVFGWIGSLDSRWWDLVPATVGGIIGALAGGLPAYFLSVRASNETATRDEQTLISSDLALLYSTAQKLTEILNGLFTICIQLNEQLDKAIMMENGDMPLHAKVLPMLGLGDDVIRFSSEEVALLFRRDQDDLANDLLLLSRRYNVNMIALSEYSERREAFTETLVPTQLKNGVGSVELGGKDAMAAKVRAHALDVMVDRLLTTFNEDRRTAMRLAKDFGRRGKIMFPNHKVPAMDYEESAKHRA